MRHFLPRAEDRHKVMVRARLRASGAESEACILDISTRGLAATAASAPARGETVELLVGKHRIAGQVQWSGERRFGVSFRERISVIAAISGKGNLALPGHRQIRRGSPPPTFLYGRSVEFMIFAAAGAIAVLLIAHYAGAALGSLDPVRAALAGA